MTDVAYGTVGDDPHAVLATLQTEAARLRADARRTRQRAELLVALRRAARRHDALGQAEADAR